MNFHQMFQTFLYCFSVHFPSAGKGNTVPQGDDPGQLIRIFISGCQPWLNFHGIGIMKQCFTNSVSDAGPSGIRIMRINIGFLIFRIKGSVTEYKCLFTAFCLCTVGTFLISAASKQTCAYTECCQKGHCLFELFCLHFFLLRCSFSASIVGIQ